MKNIMKKIGGAMLLMWAPEDRQWARELFLKRNLFRLAGGIMTALGVIVILGTIGNNDMHFELNELQDLFLFSVKLLIGLDIAALGVFVSKIKMGKKAKIIPLQREYSAKDYRKSI